MTKNSTSIAALAAWPNVQVGYLFTQQNNSPAITVQFGFDAEAYKNDNTVDEAILIADLLFYRNLQTSLKSNELILWFTTTVEATTKGEEVEHCIDSENITTQLILPIIGFLEGLLPQTETISETLNSVVTIPSFLIEQILDAEAIKNTTNIYNLSAQLVMQNVVTNTTASQRILPQGEVEGGFSLSYFAQQCESAFSQFAGVDTAFKIAAATNSNAKIPAMWVVKMDAADKNGIATEIDTNSVSFFAPQPLSTNFQNFIADISTYETGKPFPVGKPTSLNFTTVDVTNWASYFLANFQLFFTPKYTAFIRLLIEGGSVDADFFDQLQTTKQQLVQAILQSTTSITIDDSAALSIAFAQQQWEKELNINPSAAYNTTVALLWPAAVTKPNNTHEGYLCGKITTDSTTTDFNLSAACIPIQNGAAALTCTISVDKNFDYSPLVFPAATFTPQYIQLNNSHVQLPFVIPFTKGTQLQTTNVPLPCYQLPQAITLVSQNYTDSSIVYPDAKMPSAFTWDYTADFIYPSQAGTIVTVKVNLTASANSAISLLQNKTSPLFQSLAQFVNTYPAIYDDFKDYLLSPTSVAANPNNARYALLAFATLAKNSATYWGETIHPTTMLQTDTHTLEQELVFEITQEKQIGTGNLMLCLTPKNEIANQVTYQIAIEGYTAQPIAGKNNCYVYATNSSKNDYLLWQNRNVHTNYSLVAKNINILDIQTATHSLANTLNQRLINNTENNTNPNFILNGQEVSSNMVTAQFSYPTEINLALGVGSAKATLLQYITSFFDTLFAHSNTQKVTASLTVLYSYSIELSGMDAKIPVLLLPHTEIKAKDGGFSTAISDGLLNWFKNTQPNKDSGKFIFEFQLFNPTNQPSLQLQLFLMVDTITNLE